MTVGVTATTMKMCPPPIMDQESAYLANIQAAATYKIADGTLTIANAKGATVLTYKAETPISLTGGTWVMTGYNNGKQAVVSASADTEVTAIFGADGQLSGSAGCNRYNAPYTVDGNKIKIGMAITTLMACEQSIMDQEQQYLAAIQTAATYKIEGAKLELRDATNALLASYVLKAEQGVSLVGPTWVMTSYNNGKGGVVSALADTEVTAVFGETGKLSGSAGCNTYNAPYTVDGATIKIGPGMSTMMACAQPIMDQESAYLAALQTAATYKIESEKLELRTADGALAASFTQQVASPLVGPTWVMIGYNNGKQAVVSASADTEVTAISARTVSSAARPAATPTTRRIPWMAPRSRSVRQSPPARRARSRSWTRRCCTWPRSRRPPSTRSTVRDSSCAPPMARLRLTTLSRPQPNPNPRRPLFRQRLLRRPPRPQRFRRQLRKTPRAPT